MNFKITDIGLILSARSAWTETGASPVEQIN